MNTVPLSEEIALRIGLAARSLPDTDAVRLLKVLESAIGLPPTLLSLSSLSIKVLRSAHNGDLSECNKDELLEALNYLKGEGDRGYSQPEPEAYRDGDIPSSLRVAVASNSDAQLNAHFGSCHDFLIYQVGLEEIRLIDVRSTEGTISGLEKSDELAEIIHDCQILFALSIGGPAAAKVIKRDIHPIKKPEGGEALTIIKELQSSMQSGSSPWLAKHLNQSARVMQGLEAAEEREA